MKQFRELATKALVGSGLNDASAANYEKAIYNMCTRLDEGKATSETYKKMAYDKIGQLVSAQNREEREKILADIRSDKTGWEASVYSQQEENYKASMDRSTLKPKAIKGMYKCKVRSCQSDLFYVWQEQRRSGDESMSVIRQCSRCGKRGQE